MSMIFFIRLIVYNLTLQKIKTFEGLHTSQQLLFFAFLIGIQLFTSIPLVFVMSFVGAFSSFVWVFNVGFMIFFFCHDYTSFELYLLYLLQAFRYPPLIFF